jgi:hypothetical protein
MEAVYERMGYIDISIQQFAELVLYLKEKLRVVKLVALQISRQKFSSDTKLSVTPSNKTTRKKRKTFNSLADRYI